MNRFALLILLCLAACGGQSMSPQETVDSATISLKASGMVVESPGRWDVGAPASNLFVAASTDVPGVHVQAEITDIREHALNPGSPWTDSTLNASGVTEHGSQIGYFRDQTLHATAARALQFRVKFTAVLDSAAGPMYGQVIERVACVGD